MDDLKRAMDIWLSLPEPPRAGEDEYGCGVPDGAVVLRHIQHHNGAWAVGWLYTVDTYRTRWFGDTMGLGKTLLEACLDAERSSRNLGTGVAR